jgi:hypothetical protein
MSKNMVIDKSLGRFLFPQLKGEIILNDHEKNESPERKETG